MAGDADEDPDPEHALWRGIQRVSELSGLPNKKPARALIDRLLGEHPGHPQLLAQLAYCLRAEGDHAGAVEAARAALASDPEDLDALTQLAWSQYMLDDAAGAFRTTWMLLEVDPDDQDARELRGYLYLERRETEPALEAAEAMLAFEPDNARAHNLMGEVRAAMGDAAGARAAFAAALRLDPQSAQAHNGLGTVALLEDDPAAAVAATRRAARIDPEAFSPAIEAAATLGPIQHMLDIAVPGRRAERRVQGLVLVGLFLATAGGLGLTLAARAPGVFPFLGLALFLPALLLALPIGADPLQPLAYRVRAWVGAPSLALAVLGPCVKDPWTSSDTAALALLAVGLSGRLLGSFDSREARVLSRLRDRGDDGVETGASDLDSGYVHLSRGDAEAARGAFDLVLDGPVVDEHVRELAKSGRELATTPVRTLFVPEFENEGAFIRAPGVMRTARDRASIASSAGFAAACVAVAAGAGPVGMLVAFVVSQGASHVFGAAVPWAPPAIRRHGRWTGGLAIAGALAGPLSSGWIMGAAAAPMLILRLSTIPDPDEEGPDPAG